MDKMVTKLAVWQDKIGQVTKNGKCQFPTYDESEKLENEMKIGNSCFGRKFVFSGIGKLIEK